MRGAESTFGWDVMCMGGEEAKVKTGQLYEEVLQWKKNYKTVRLEIMFLNLGTVDILDLIILSCGRLLCASWDGQQHS